METCDSVIFRTLIERISSCCMIDNHSQILYPKIICPGCRQIDFLDHILSVFIIKMPVSHKKPSCFAFIPF